MNNLPSVRVGIVVSSRGNFSSALSEQRLQSITALLNTDNNIAQSTVLQTENDVPVLLRSLKKDQCNALVIYLGNFGPEIAESLLASRFDGPVMFAAAAEEDMQHLGAKRGDAYCGLLNAGYNLSMVGKRIYMSAHPVGQPTEVAHDITQFHAIARAQLSLKALKLITFGPRPNEFVACNAPILPLYSLGIGVQENSELDLYASFLDHTDDARISQITEAMQQETNPDTAMKTVLPKLAQYELTLLDWVEQNKGAYDYVCMANKCWPAFERCFGFVPCYVNSRFAARCMPIACEVDMYGAVSEYLLSAITGEPATLLDINNTVPPDLYTHKIANQFAYRQNELFMGFHCGNTPKCLIDCATLTHHTIMARQPGVNLDTMRGTLEGNLKPGQITLFRLQADANGHLHAYIAQGEVLPVAAESFGCIGIFAVKEMDRFYRYGLLAGHFPHHCAVVYAPVGKLLFDLLHVIGIEDIIYNQSNQHLYSSENPFTENT